LLKRFNPHPFVTLLLVLTLSILSGCATQQKNNADDEWFAKDKYTHFLLSTAISAAVANAAKNNGNENCDAALIGFSVTLTLGAAKETYDKRKKGTFYSYRDMVWDAAGSATGSLLGSNCL
jgi:putative lipoprotein